MKAKTNFEIEIVDTVPDGVEIFPKERIQEVIVELLKEGVSEDGIISIKSFELVTVE